MSSSRLKLDLAVIGVLVVAGVLLYPWGQRQYYARLLTSPNPEQAEAAQHALSRMGSDAVPVLATVVRTGASSAGRIRAFEALAEIDDDRVLQIALDVAAADWDQELQSKSLQLLGTARVVEVQPICEALLHDPDSRIRYDALRAYLTTNPPNAVPQLMPLLDDPELIVAGTAALALGQITGTMRPYPGGNSPEAQAARAESTRAWKAWYATQPDADRAPPGGRPAPAASTPIARPRAVDFTLPTLDGATIRLSDFRGKPVLVNFWSTWCPPCIRETAGLVQAAAELGADAVILGVSGEYKNDEPARRELERRGTEATPEAIAQLQDTAVRTFLAQHGVPYPNVVGDTATLDAYNAYALPTTVIIRPDGVVHRRLIGERTKDYFLAALRDAAR